MSDKGKILITDNCDPLLIEGLQKLGYAVDYKPQTTQKDVEEHLPDYTGIVITTKTILSRLVLEKAGRLKFIARAGSGMEMVDVEFAQQKNIICINSPEGNRDSVAEHAIGLLLSLYHHIPRSFYEIKNGEWNTEANRVNELQGQTIGIIGYGNTGSAFAKKLSGFNVQVIAYDKYKKNFGDSFAKQVTMDEIFTQSDVLSLHVPITPETSYMVNTVYINSFKKPFYLLNTSRGKVVDTNSLIKGLKDKKVLGAGLDVLENEQMSNYKPQEKEVLKQLMNAGEIVITPHVAGKSFQSKKRFAEVLLAKISDI